MDLWRPYWIFAYLAYFRSSNFLGLLVCYSGHFIEDLCAQINSVAFFSISKVSLPGLLYGPLRCHNLSYWIDFEKMNFSTKFYKKRKKCLEIFIYPRNISTEFEKNAKIGC